MSLVDYAVSSDEDDEQEENREEREEPKVSEKNTFVVEDTRRRLEAITDPSPPPKLDSPLPQTLPQTQRLGSGVNRRGAEISQPSESPALKLPDASLLLNSPAMPSNLAYATDHSSRVAAAMAESESRKRDLNGTSSSSNPRSKGPRGNLRHSKSIPDAVDGRLLPPQLAGRSNVVTEDISKLFVMRHADSSSD